MKRVRNPNSVLLKFNPVKREKLPTEKLPTEKLPTEKLPTEKLPTEKLPTEKLPTEKLPTEKLPTEKLPTEKLPDIKLGKYPCFQLSVLQNLATQHGYAAFCQETEDKRCEADILYRLFHRPDTVVNKMLRGLVEIIKKKNSPDLEQSRMFQDGMAFLLHHPRADAQIKLFYILLIINHEPETHAIIKAGVTSDNMWGKQWDAHFKVFVKELDTFVKETFNTRFGETDILQRVEYFNVTCEILYLSK